MVLPRPLGVAGEATDHPHHQSMHYNHPINGVDFWHGKHGERIRNDEIVKALKHSDPRVRRSALEGIDNYNSYFGSKAVLELILQRPPAY